MTIGLVLFFTRGVSLRTWNMVGMLDREVAVYKQLRTAGFDVSFLTYGGPGDLEFADRLDGIRVLCNESDLPFEEYEESMLEIYADSLRSAHIIKTNQTYGADAAQRAAERFSAGFVARCGYMWSQNAAREFGSDSPKAIEARSTEERVFKAADRVVVTTEVMRSDVLQRIPEAAVKTVVIPNYVDTATFRPQPGLEKTNTVVFVGRIAPEKNLGALLEAIEPLPVRLILIGEGKLRSELQSRFAHLGDKVVWEGNVPNSLLPEFLNRAVAFVLPSLYEGHPKSLAEAMACGVPVVGADSTGIREMIRHGETGLLCGTDPASIRAALKELITDEALRRRLGTNARAYIQDHYSLDRIAELEISLLTEVARR
ncbi:MAG: glycosyltransferase family 4 protein [Desulfomonile sp.]|nr:glycosyltransferase family 4 protein [Desulfomonile sp.]